MTSIVIIDDQTLNLRILERFAGDVDNDVEVRTFTSPVEALSSVAERTPDLIVTDFVMPIISGEEFILRCRQTPALELVPIIVVTAFEDREFRYRALDIGASDFPLSPVDAHEFRTRARNLITLGRYQRALTCRASLLEDELAIRTRQHAEALRERERHLRRVVNSVPALLRVTDVRGRIVFHNTAHASFFDIDEGLAPGKEKPVDLEYCRRHRQLDRRVVESGEQMLGIEETVSDRGGSQRVLLTTKAPLGSFGGGYEQVVTVSVDITERKRVEREISESEQRFRSLIEGSVLGIVIERDGVPIFANRTFARIFGFEKEDDVLQLPSLERLFAPNEQLRRQRLLTLTENGAVPGPHEFECVREDRTAIWVEMQTQAVSWGGRPALQSTVADISLRKAYEERLHRQANFDEITGLPNRSLALDRLRAAVLGTLRHNHCGGVLFIDLDQFKKINDTWGHATGDRLLRMAAERIRGCVREEDTVARFGGDEFAVILPNITNPGDTEAVANKILNVFSDPFVLGVNEAFVTASIGVTVFPNDSTDPAMLLQNADAAMYRAKELGRNTFQHFTTELNEQAAERMRIEGQLLRALERDEFVLHFQPIIDLRSLQIVSAEALLRWANPHLGVFPPDRFVPLAEDTGLIVPVGRWILDTACRQLGEWRRAGLTHLTMSVNISSRQLRGKGLVDAVTQALVAHGIPPAALELEITESCLMSDFDEMLAALRVIDRMGVRLALDDFGTGYSSLSYIKQLPVDSVKIDKSFVTSAGQDAGDATVVETIIAMSHQLGMRVIGEGVETAEHVEFIRRRGCDLAQGFYFGRPLTADAFFAWCEDWSRSHARTA
ncbi:MAG: EAL domain-containing protein [Rhodospirillales bacterium]|nr:EAL domain-containing protein [Rhodospirillales bacterium]